jgi:hypothetical protein
LIAEEFAYAFFAVFKDSIQPRTDQGMSQSAKRFEWEGVLDFVANTRSGFVDGFEKVLMGPDAERPGDLLIDESNARFPRGNFREPRERDPE